jgi:hypothetical protein
MKVVKIYPKKDKLLIVIDEAGVSFEVPRSWDLNQLKEWF